MSDINDSYFAKVLPLCGWKLLVTTALYPMEYTKVLIQIGHEPIAPVNTRTFFGRPAKRLPNVIRYAQHISNKDGLCGLFRGLSPRLCTSMLTSIISNEIEEYFDDKTKTDSTSNTEEPSKEKLLVDTLKKKLSISVVTLTVTQPLHVVTVRMMAQFIGRETKYSGVLSSLFTIFKEEGISGFFAGFIPRLVGEVSFLVLYETMMYGMKKLIESEDGLPDSMASLLVDFSIRNYLYPFHVLDSCMAVNNCGLMAGQPPCMPYYKSSYDCYKHLDKVMGLNRGASLILRYLPEVKEEK